MPIRGVRWWCGTDALDDLPAAVVILGRPVRHDVIRYRAGQTEAGEDTHGFLIESNGTGPDFDVCGSIECLDPETKVVSQVRRRGADRAKAHDHHISVKYVGHVRTFPDRNQLWQGVELSVGMSEGRVPPSGLRDGTGPKRTGVWPVGVARGPWCERARSVAECGRAAVSVRDARNPVSPRSIPPAAAVRRSLSYGMSAVPRVLEARRLREPTAAITGIRPPGRAAWRAAC